VIVIHAVVEAQRDESGRRLATARAPRELGDRHDLESGVEEETELFAEGLGPHAQEARVDARARRADPVVQQDGRPAGADQAGRSECQLRCHRRQASLAWRVRPQSAARSAARVVSHHDWPSREQPQPPHANCGAGRDAVTENSR
jgi:hypothetical protein